MAIDFPDQPVHNQTFVSNNIVWVYDQYSGSWGQVVGATVQSVTSDNMANWDAAYASIVANSGYWSQGGSGSSSGGGGAAAFITNVTCGTNATKDDGITQKTYDTTQVSVGTYSPLLTALVDTPTTRVYCQWEGPSDDWTGAPIISGTEISSTTMSSVGGGYARRFQGYVDFDFSSNRGEALTIPVDFNNVQHEAVIEIAPAGPTAQSVVITSSPSYSQDHYKDGDSVTFVAVFDDTDVDSITLHSGGVTETVNDSTNFTMNGVSATMTATVDSTSVSMQHLPVVISAKNTLGTAGDTFTSAPLVSAMSGPVIVDSVFGSYPGSQTELKSNDEILTTFVFDTTNVNIINTFYNSSNAYASKTQTDISFQSQTGVSATALVPIQTSSVVAIDRPIYVNARKTFHHSIPGPYYTSTQTLTVNNLYPTIVSPIVQYPGTQTALDLNQSTTIDSTVSDFDSIEYTDNNTNQLSIADSTSYTQTKSVTATAAVYNIGNVNYKIQATRAANDAVSTKTSTINIASVDPELQVSITKGGSSVSKLRSGGTAASTQQSYDVTVTSNQRLLLFDMDAATGYGSLSNNNWSSSSNGTTWSNSIVVADTDNKGVVSWDNVQATNIAARQVDENQITSGEQYELAGFVSRSVTYPAGSRTAAIGTHVVQASNVQASETLGGTYTFDSSTTNGTILNTSLANGVNVSGKFTIVASSNTSVVNLTGDTWFNLDRSFAGSRATATTLTIQETV